MSERRSLLAAGHVSRREFPGRVAAGVAAAPLLGAGLAGCATTASTPATAGATATRQSRHNILFVFTDQERYFRQWPAGFTLPGRERLQKTGVTFYNHDCPATMCTPSRSVLMTGLQTADNGMFENLDLPWTKDLSPAIPTIGHMLRKAGYYTASRESGISTARSTARPTGSSPRRWRSTGSRTTTRRATSSGTSSAAITSTT